MKNKEQIEILKLKNNEKIDLNLVYAPSSLINSVVEKILTTDWDFNALSSDQIGIFLDKASTKYSISFGSGQISFALKSNCSNSEKDTNLILENIRDVANLRDSSSRFDFLIISFLYFSISSNKYSGANKEKLFRKIKSRVFPFIEISAEITMFASIINSIQKVSGCSFLNLSCIDFFIFLPISKASFSVSLDLDAIELRIFNWNTLSRIASLATSDQFMNLDLSISAFKSDGTDKVIVGIFYPFIFNIFNIFNILKSFGFAFDRLKGKRSVLNTIQTQPFISIIGGASDFARYYREANPKNPSKVGNRKHLFSIYQNLLHLKRFYYD